MTMNLIEPPIPEVKVMSVWQRSSRFIVCSFCQLRGRQVGTSPLCSNCLIDPVQTRIAIESQIANIAAQEAQAYAAWSQLCEAHLAFWEKLLAGRAKATDADHRARQAHPTYALLLDAEQTYERDQQALRVERERLSRALEEI
jgi:hypothetical protein